MTSSNGSIFRGALMLFMIRAWINGWVNNREAGELRRHHAHYDVIVMPLLVCCSIRNVPLKSLWPSDAIWCHRSRSTLAQAMVCFLTDQSIAWTNVDNFNDILWYSPKSTFIRSDYELILWHVFGDHTFKIDTISWWRHQMETFST